jgi:L-lactate dehydrogenase
MPAYSETASKVAVVGAGHVGATFAYAACIQGLCRELAIINRTRAKAEGEAMDLHHSLPFLQPMEITAGGYELAADAQLVVVTAGAAQAEGQSRLELARTNARITEDIVERVLEHNHEPVILMVSNPVDVLTHVAQEKSGLPRGRVLGTGTALDTARFRYLLSENCNLDPRNVHGYVVGEHGKSEVALWSTVRVGGVLLDDYCRTCPKECAPERFAGIAQEVRDAAFQVIERKGATYYAIGMAMVRIAQAVLADQHSVLTVSTRAPGYYGLGEVCLSLPCVVGSRGVEEVLQPKLSDQEGRDLARSARVLKESLAQAGYGDKEAA